MPVTITAAATAATDPIRIVDFAPQWRGDFARLNLEWLQRWFVVEPIDHDVLHDPQTHLLADGGRVLFAIAGNNNSGDRVVGTVALKHEGDGVYELTKMAVDPRSVDVGSAAC